MSDFLSVRDVTNILWSRQDTGHSVNLRGDTPKSGYMVGGWVPSLVIEGEDLDRTPLAVTDKWLLENYRLLQYSSWYAGIWTDQDTGKVYIDISQNIQSREVALGVAAELEELAVWDVENNEEIRVNEVVAA